MSAQGSLIGFVSLAIIELLDCSMSSDTFTRATGGGVTRADGARPLAGYLLQVLLIFSQGTGITAFVKHL